MKIRDTTRLLRTDRQGFVRRISVANAKYGDQAPSPKPGVTNMSSWANRLMVAIVCLLVLDVPNFVRADVVLTRNGEIIPGTEGICPGPGVVFDGLALVNAEFRTVDLTGASFRNSNLSSANFFNATLEQADFSGATITDADFEGSQFTKEQLYSTNSYQAGFLRGVDFPANVSNWDFSGQDLSYADFDRHFELATLTDADFTNAIISGTRFSSNAIFYSSSGVRRNASDGWLTPAQLYSTANYQSRDLREVWFRRRAS